MAELFTYSRGEYAGQTARMRPVNMAEILTRAAAGLQARAEDRHVRICLSGPAEGCFAEGDADLLERAIENLLDNAIRCSQEGGKVEVSWHQEGERAVFSVADSGPGIPAQDLPHLFEPMYRGDASRSAKTGGAGLGLSIAKRVLEAHGGDLVAANRAGGGAEFTAWLTRATAGIESRE